MKPCFSFLDTIFFLTLSTSVSGLSQSGQLPVRRYSSLYGISLSCLELVPQSLLEILLPTSSTNSISGLNARFTGSSDYYSHQNNVHHSSSSLVKHLSGGLSQSNITFEWQTRPISATSGSSSYRSSSSSPSSTLLSSSAGQFVTISEPNSQRFITKDRDGQLQIPPFEPEQYTSEVHDAYYRCLVRLSSTSALTSREIRLQVGKFEFTLRI